MESTKPSPDLKKYSRVNTTVFDVWDDWKEYREGNLAGHFSNSKLVLAMKVIARELQQRMNVADRTLLEGLWDLEKARVRLREKGGRSTIACLVSAIMLKHGGNIDKRRKQLVLEY